MPLLIEPYLAQLPHWPPQGHHILAQYDDQTVVVYQAYPLAIGKFAVQHGYFGVDFKLNRMTWIKPNFLWMMHRSGWGTKSGQEIVLAIWLRRDAFDTILASAVHSTFVEGAYDSYQAWQRALKKSDVRLQWDPDYTPDDRRVGRRAIQLGLQGQTAANYAQGSWIIRIEDISLFVAEQRARKGLSSFESLHLPRERVYSLTDSRIALKLQLSTD